jgi:hypothetical protein
VILLPATKGAQLQHGKEFPEITADQATHYTCVAVTCVDVPDNQSAVATATAVVH